jgi:DNA-binding IscR family transcriptional regulator
MKVSQKGLYALQALMMLARHYSQGAIRIRDVAYEENLPEKFLELILLELKNARIVESARRQGRLPLAPLARGNPVERDHPPD